MKFEDWVEIDEADRVWIIRLSTGPASNRICPHKLYGKYCGMRAEDVTIRCRLEECPLREGEQDGTRS